MKKLIALILVAVFAFSLVGCGGVGVDTSSPEGAARTYMNAMAKVDPKALFEVTLIHNLDVVMAYTDLDAEEKAELREEIEKDRKAMEKSAGDAQRVNCTILSVTVDYEDDGALDEMDDLGLMDAVQNFAAVEVEYKMSYNGESRTDSMEIECVKIGGNWYVVGY